MFSNDDLWNAIDTLAQNNHMSPSGMARAAGLDPTTFNKSKRKSKYGQPRWLSFDTLGKVLRLTNTTLSEFAQIIENHEE